MTMRHLLVLAAPIACLSPAAAQEQDAKLWTTLNGSLPLAERLALEVEATARFSDADDGLYETIQALWITRELESGAELAIGYQRNDTARTHPGTIENRLRQQVAMDVAELAGGTLSGQLRFEQRFRSDGRDVHFRLRPQIAYQRPFTPGGPTSWTIRHESFFGSDADWNQQTGLFRFRHEISIEHELTEDLDVRAGYLNQYQFGRDGDGDTIDHVALVSLSYSG